MLYLVVYYFQLHGALSALMFYVVCCLQRRFNSRSVVELSGILQLSPMLGIVIILTCALYVGLLSTLKFICEFYIFCVLFEITSLISAIPFYVANVIGLVAFSKC